MVRTLISSASSLAVGSALLVAVGLVAIGGAASGTGCSSQETSAAPDASRAPCERGPFAFCQPTTIDKQGCNTDDGGSRLLERLPKSARYPLGCSVNFVGERDEQGDCKLEAVCTCVLGTQVTPVPNDAAAEGGDAGGPVPGAAGDGGATGPVWRCG